MLQAHQMLFEREGLSRVHTQHFEDAISKEKASVKNRNARLLRGDTRSVDPNLRHERRLALELREKRHSGRMTRLLDECAIEHRDRLLRVALLGRDVAEVEVDVALGDARVRVELL